MSAATIPLKKHTKTNERAGTRAQARFVRVSAYKAREVLDLVRGKSYGEAAEILAFSERAIARTIAKVLDSAVANAENNDGLDAEELFVSACYADEGPTLKRWRPRARGRATRIRKRTCHITVIVTRYSAEQLAAFAARDAERGTAGRSANAADARRARVAQSKARAEAAAEAAAEAEHDHEEDTSVLDDASVDSDADGIANADDVSPFGEFSALPLEDGAAPSDDYTIKGNADSMLYHPPTSPFYDRTVAEVWFTTAEAAEAAGFSLPPSLAKDAESSDADSTEEED